MPSNSSIAKSCKVVTVRQYDPGTLMTGVEHDILVCGCGGPCETKGGEFMTYDGKRKTLAVCQACGENFSMEKTYPTEERKF